MIPVARLLLGVSASAVRSAAHWPREFDAHMRDVGGQWEAGARRWLIGPRAPAAD